MSAQPLITYEGKRVIVTGAYSGIGASLVEMIKQSGAEQITVLDIKAPDADVDRFIETDMGNPLSIDAAIAEILADDKLPIDILFNNAGVAATVPADVVMRVNTLGLGRLT